MQRAVSGAPGGPDMVRLQGALTLAEEVQELVPRAMAVCPDSGDTELPDSCWPVPGRDIRTRELAWFRALFWRTGLAIVIWNRVVPENASNPGVPSRVVGHRVDLYSANGPRADLHFSPTVWVSPWSDRSHLGGAAAA